MSKEFSLSGDKQWKPFSYEKRLKDARDVTKKKLSMKNTKKHNPLTKYISNELKSRQEEILLVGEYIDIARCGPLHLKNNCTKELFMKVFNTVIAESKFPTSIKCFKEVSENNFFHKFLAIIWLKNLLHGSTITKNLKRNVNLVFGFVERKVIIT